jgi:hypothetical protein
MDDRRGDGAILLWSLAPPDCPHIGIQVSHRRELHGVAEGGTSCKATSFASPHGTSLLRPTILFSTRTRPNTMVWPASRVFAATCRAWLLMAQLIASNSGWTYDMVSSPGAGPDETNGRYNSIENMPFSLNSKQRCQLYQWINLSSLSIAFLVR